MRSRWRELYVLAGTLTGVQTYTSAQQATEIGIQAIGTASDPALAVAGVYGGLRTAARTRVSAALGVGVAGRGGLAWRGEVLGHFLLSPSRRVGVGFYIAGGLAAVEGPVDRGYLVLLAGLEQRPRSGEGWTVELGVGGGPRLALGYRWRRFKAPRLR